ncbi:SRPBCC family protein [Nocardia sp. NPDC003482]
MTHTAFASSVLDAPIDRVWAFFDDFDGLAAFHPAIVASRIEDGPGPREVGAVRYLTLADGFVRERLLKFEPSNHEYEYSIIESSMPMREYVAGVLLTPVTDTGATFAQWWADFTVEGADPAEFARFVSEQVFAAGLRAVAERLR